MSLLTAFPSIPKIKPSFNLGALFDIPTGAYYKGIHGENVLNGGLPHILSVAGPGNSFKSAIVDHINLVVCDRIPQYTYSKYDTEVSANYNRINQLSAKLERMRLIDHSDENLPEEQVRMKITSSAQMLGDVYFEAVKDMAESKRKTKGSLLSTPFLDSDFKPIQIKIPVGIMIDSLSAFKVTSNETNIIDKNALGDSGNNMYAMRQGAMKKQLITQLPNIAEPSGLYFTMTAHVGDEFVMDAMAPKKHKLTYSKKGSKIIGTTKEFEFINNLLYEIFSSSPLNNKESRTGVLYPIIDSDRDEDCTDLLMVLLKVTRNKSGPTGMPIELVISQREGLLPHLSMFHYIKEMDRYGLDGNNTTYHLDLLPDINLSRTTVRRTIDENAKVRRALEITSEMLQMRMLWANLPEHLLCTPAQLYNDIKALGYDWDILLNTRGWWTFKENEEDELPFLSTMDLLELRAGKYQIYWLNDDKATFNQKYKHLLTEHSDG